MPVSVWSDRNRRLAVILTAGCLFLSFHSCSKQPSKTAAVAHFDVLDVDLGEVRLEQKYHARFRLTNRGTAPLSILEIKPTCGCLVADFDRSEILPQQSREITLSLDTHKQPTRGAIAKQAAVFLSNGEEIDLRLMAQIGSDFLLEPTRLEFSATDDVATLRVTRKLMTVEEFGHVTVKADSDVYSVREQSISADERVYQVRLVTPAAGAVQPSLALVSSKTGAAIPFGNVSAFRQGPVLRPSTLVIVAGKSEPPAPQRFQLVGDPSASIRIVSIEWEDDEGKDLLDISFRPEIDASSFEVQLKDRPEGTVSTPKLRVRYSSDNGSSGGSVQLDCHIVALNPEKAS